jgi:RHS repeat-associated protein
VQYGNSQYRYNALGQLAAKTSAGKEVSYKYDPLGNLQTAVLAKDKHVEYVVDGLGRRIGKKINGALKQGFLYREKVGPLAELDSENRVISRFVYAEQPQVPEYLEKEGERFRIVADPVGSPRCVVNAATGQIVQRLDYDPFGAVESDTNPAFQPFGFAGGLYDPDLGLARMGFRDYDAESGRWTAKDPLGFAGGDANLYAYVSNDPPNRNDPWGLQEQLPIFTSGTGGGIVINIIENRVSTSEERLNRSLRQAGNEEAWRQWNRGGGGFSPVFNIGNTGGTFEPGTVGNTGPHSEHDGTENFPGVFEDDARGGPDRRRNPHEPPCPTTYGGTVRIPIPGL